MVNPSSPPELLVSRASQRRLQPPLYLVPIGIFGLQLLLDRLDFGAQRGCPSRVLLLRFFKSRLRLVDGLLPAFALLLPGRLLPGFFALATLPLAFVGLGGLPIDRLVGCAEDSFALADGL
jgi:hypothetical protein